MADSYKIKVYYTPGSRPFTYCYNTAKAAKEAKAFYEADDCVVEYIGKPKHKAWCGKTEIG